MVQFYDTYTLPEFQVISERLRLHEFVQMPSAQIEGCEIVTGKSPVGLFAKLADAGKAPKDVAAENAATLEKIADEVVKK